VKTSSLLTTTLVVLIGGASFAALSCNRTSPPRPFPSAEDAVHALIDAAKSGKPEAVVAIFGADGKDLLDTTDAASARRNAQTFAAAAAERWKLVDEGADKKILVIGNEDWPFPVPLARTGSTWHFDTAAGKEEVLARRIGRNELAAIRICRTYVAAQRVYAERGHDGQNAGLYARAFTSDPGKQNGLYWAVTPGQKRSPLGDLVAYAESKGQPVNKEGQGPSPFHGYYFRILTAQGSDAPGGAKDYIVNGLMSGGFALVAWPAQYDATGIMTFLVSHEGVVREKDLGSDTEATVKAITSYNPDASWASVAQ
jgi:hypothetical protein